MKCSNCGTALPQWANKCPDCGTVCLGIKGPLQSELPLRSHLWVAILISCFCPPLGAPAIVYAVLADVRLRAGQRDEAFAMAELAWYWIRLTVVTAMVFWALVCSYFLWFS